MFQHPDTDTDGGADGDWSRDADHYPDGGAGVQVSRDLALPGMSKQKLRHRPEGFHGITIKERDRRMTAVGLLARQSFEAGQVVNFLPVWGLKLSRSQVYSYLQKLPPRPRRTGDRRIHDRLAIDHLTRIALDAARAGLQVDERLEVGRQVTGFRFKPDARFYVPPLGFMLEEQIALLPEARWRDKARAHLRHFLATGDRSRRLFVCPGAAEMGRGLGHTAAVLDEEGGERGLLLFITREELEDERDKVLAPVWHGIGGKLLPLVQWHPLLEPKLHRPTPVT
jgi:hypothetical protein